MAIIHVDSNMSVTLDIYQIHIIQSSTINLVNTSTLYYSVSFFGYRNINQGVREIENFLFIQPSSLPQYQGKTQRSKGLYMCIIYFIIV